MHLNPTERKAFQHNLNRYIDEAGMTLYQAAKIAGVPQSTLHYWSVGRAFPQNHKKASEVLAKLAPKALKAENGRKVDMPKPTENYAATMRKAVKEINTLIENHGIKASVTEDGRVRLGMTVWYE